MGSLDSVISSLYTNFLLRDIAAKIVPGGLLLLALPVYRSSLGEVVAAARSATLVEAAAFCSVAWAVSYAVQALGEATGAIHQWPPDRDPFIHRYQTRVLFSRFASDHERRLVERYVVIKEASGTAFLSLFLAAALISAQGLIDVFARWFALAGTAFGEFLTIWLVPIAALLVAAYSWKQSHEKHLKRQYAEIDAVITLGPHDRPATDGASRIRDAIVEEIVSRKAVENGRPPA